MGREKPPGSQPGGRRKTSGWRGGLPCPSGIIVAESEGDVKQEHQER